MKRLLSVAASTAIFGVAVDVTSLYAPGATSA